MADEKKLPDLPGSTDEDLRRNPYHGFYKKKARDVWDQAVIQHPEVGEVKKCDHVFEYSKDGVECKKCHMGLIGQLNIIDGKLVLA